MRRFWGFVAGMLSAVGMAQAEMAVTLVAPWDGVTVPAGEQCPKDGGHGSTPAMTATGLPEGTARLRLEFNDFSYEPLAFRGGHGVIEWMVTGDSTDIPALPGMTADLPEGAVLVSKARTKGTYASDGYLPPCSGGSGNLYAVVIKALAADGAELEKVTVKLGHY